MYTRQHNKSTLHLLDNQSNGNFHQDHLNKDIYYQHLKNKGIYEKIKEINPYFGYTLKCRNKNENNEMVALIREHDSLLQEYGYLVNQLNKMRFQAQSIERQIISPLNFFKEMWHTKQSNNSEFSNERIDRLNKNIAFIKTNVSELVHKHQHNDLQYEALIYSTKEYQELALKYQRIKLQHEQLKQQLQSNNQSNENKQKDHENDHLMEEQRQEQIKYGVQIKRLQENNSKLTSLNKTMLSKISKLTQDIIERDKQINQLKSNTGIVKKYSSSTLNCEKKPIFQITIKQNTQDMLNSSALINKMVTPNAITSQSLDLITSFIENTYEHKPNDAFNIINDNNLSMISISDNSQFQKTKDLQDLMNYMEGKENERASFSDRKPLKQLKKRQFVFNPRLLLGQNDQNLDLSKQFRFVRRK